jgi:hypothetical protein
MRSELSYADLASPTSLVPPEPPFDLTQIINVPKDQMITDETNNGNSPTPKADVPLVITASMDPVMQLLLSIQAQLAKTDQRLAKTDDRLMAIEKGERPFDPTWDNDTNYNMAHDGATFANYEFSEMATHHCN